MKIANKRKTASTRRMIGVDAITANSVRTYEHGEIVYFIIQPTNLAVLSQTIVAALVRNLMNLLKGAEALDILCMSARDSYDTNKATLMSRMDKETSEPIRRLLEQDLAHLDEIQSQTASAREFLITLRFRESDDVLPSISRFEKLLKEHGFRARVADKNDIKRIFAVYFNPTIPQIVMDEVDGMRWVEQEEI